MSNTKENKARRAAIKLVKTAPEIHCLDPHSYAVYSLLILEILSKGYSKSLAKLIPAWEK